MKIFLITFSLIVLTLTALGTTVGTPASIATRGLRMIITRYLANGGDISTLTMEKVMEMVDREAANSIAQGKFEDRFEILGGSGPIDQSSMAKVIAYTANRVGEDRRDVLGRYVIWLSGEEVYYDWEPEEKVSALFNNAGMKLVDRGLWSQPDTKAQSMFHVGVGPKPPTNDNRVQEDQAGRRLSIPNATSQNNQQQHIAQQPGTISEPRTTPEAKSCSTPMESGAKSTTTSEALASIAWLVWGVVTVAAISLLWLLLKPRK
jgi:hypothetical protein